ncbi:MAG: hypothetical protein PHU14_06235 [Methylovulum sp.]|nr:hypothetical protein [Methylovulum sp.]
MSYKTRLIKMAIKWTPTSLILWVANIALKGIAQMTAFEFDLDARKVYVQLTLAGEAEAIEVSLDGFTFASDGQTCQVSLLQAQSNRLWLDNILARVTGKVWTVPVPPQLAPHIGLVVDLFKVETPAQAVAES